MSHSIPPYPELSASSYRPDIDGLRALAVLAVVGFHAFPAWISGGFIGVDIFFVISGYLISSIIFSGLERSTFSFIDFYSRRVRRIFPALTLVLLASFAFGWFALLADEYKQFGKHMVGGAGFISNLLLWQESGYFDTAAETKPLCIYGHWGLRNNSIWFGHCFYGCPIKSVLISLRLPFLLPSFLSPSIFWG